MRKRIKAWLAALGAYLAREEIAGLNRLVGILRRQLALDHQEINEQDAQIVALLDSSAEAASEAMDLHAEIDRLLVREGFYSNLPDIAWPPDGQVIVGMAASLCHAVDKTPDVSGEFKRHQVYARLIKLYPNAPRRVLSLAIELALANLPKCSTSTPSL